MSELNTIYYNDPNRQLIVNNTTNEFIVSGYRLVIDASLNRDLSLVEAPLSPTSPGKKGNLSFDRNYVYYCLNDNLWARSALASWEGIKPTPLNSTLETNEIAKIPQPSNWWSFTTDASPSLGDYNFTSYGSNTFSSSGVYIGNTAGNSSSSLLNYSTNIVEPTTLNQSFSISFETKRLNINNAWGNQFVLGSAFGQLGFHFEYTNSNYTSSGDYLTFNFSTHTPATYNWTRVKSLNTITGAGYHQIIGVNDSYNKAIILYVDGQLQGSGKYITPGSKYYGSPFKGFGIGANPNGSTDGNPVYNTEYNTKTIIRYMGFWKNYALTSGQVSSLYNNGSFNRFPFN